MKLLDRIANWLRRLLGAWDDLERELSSSSSSSSAPPGGGDPQPPGGGGGKGSPSAAAGATPDGADFASLLWTWGGFDGSRAKAVDGCRVRSLKVSPDGLSYSWEAGGCERLGASSVTDAACLACLFCRVGGHWRGGKFDWISTSRRTRSFENIREGYGGWPRNAVAEADAFAFVIVSRDGRRRTNVAVREGRA